MVCNELEDSLTLVGSYMACALAFPAWFTQAVIIPITSSSTTLITSLFKVVLGEYVFHTLKALDEFFLNTSIFIYK